MRGESDQRACCWFRGYRCLWLKSLSYFPAAFRSPAPRGDRHLREPSPDQGQGDRVLPVYEPKRQARGEGECHVRGAWGPVQPELENQPSPPRALLASPGTQVCCGSGWERSHLVASLPITMVFALVPAAVRLRSIYGCHLVPRALGFDGEGYGVLEQPAHVRLVSGKREPAAQGL